MVKNPFDFNGIRIWPPDPAESDHKKFETFCSSSSRRNNDLYTHCQANITDI